MTLRLVSPTTGLFTVANISYRIVSYQNINENTHN